MLTEVSLFKALLCHLYSSVYLSQWCFVWLSTQASFFCLPHWWVVPNSTACMQEFFTSHMWQWHKVKHTATTKTVVHLCYAVKESQSRSLEVQPHAAAIKNHKESHTRTEAALIDIDYSGGKTAHPHYPAPYLQPWPLLPDCMDRRKCDENAIREMGKAVRK